ncbi:MAG: pyrimidine dimer DNA glycosylase/endonuclease V [Patescibacteria group bacterium]|nr:pyrimidine dimer DNA glycosylase/endonuclease V [Patescibacteria group bacterium]
MRLWSIHPKYLDKKGLLAVWRECLLAKKVLEGKTKGYKYHPQLIRFKNYKNPLAAINAYLFEIYKEAKKRGYNFDKKKIKIVKLKNKIPVNSGQIKFEFKHLLKKLKLRDGGKYKKINLLKKIEINPVFFAVPGKREKWEKT